MLEVARTIITGLLFQKTSHQQVKSSPGDDSMIGADTTINSQKKMKKSDVMSHSMVDIQQPRKNKFSRNDVQPKEFQIVGYEVI